MNPQNAEQQQQVPGPGFLNLPGVEAWAQWADVAQLLMGLVLSAESSGDPGPAKREFVINTVYSILKVVEVFEGDQFDDAGFKAAIGDFIDAFVAFQKAQVKLRELNAVITTAAQEAQTAIMGLRAARVEKAQSKIVLAAPRIELIKK
jgi:hypothetical protein